MTEGRSENCRTQQDAQDTPQDATADTSLNHNLDRLLSHFCTFALSHISNSRQLWRPAVFRPTLQNDSREWWV